MNRTRTCSLEIVLKLWLSVTLFWRFCNHGLATIVNNGQRCIAQRMSRRYCLKVTEFYCISSSGSKEVHENSVEGVVPPPPPPSPSAKCCSKSVRKNTHFCDDSILCLTDSNCLLSFFFALVPSFSIDNGHKTIYITFK